MQKMSEFQQGWDFVTSIMGTDNAVQMGQNYVDKVEAAIKLLEDHINNHPYRNLSPDQLQGYLFEEWLAGTFNLEATVSESPYRAELPHSTEINSPDIVLERGGQKVDEYSAKSYGDGKRSGVAQAGIDPETGRARYEGQNRVVPTDQLQDAKREVSKRAGRNRGSRDSVADVYDETNKKLTDRITADDGTESTPVTRKKLDEIAQEGKQGKFKAKDHDITPNKKIKNWDVGKKAFKAGCTAALITVVLQLAPEIFKAIDFLVKNGEIDIEQIKSMGTNGVSTGVEAFVKGATASAIEIMSQKGALGEVIKNVSPTTIGIIVVIVYQILKDSILIAAGKKTMANMIDNFVGLIVVIGGAYLGSKIGEMLGGMLPIPFAGPVLGFVLGSLLGAVFSSLFNIGKNKYISFYAEKGYTCFGLVEQNYELPHQVLEELGIMADLPILPVEEMPILSASEIPILSASEMPITPIGEITSITTTEKAQDPIVSGSESMTSSQNYETIAFTRIRRGVIGVRKVGYVIG